MIESLEIKAWKPEDLKAWVSQLTQRLLHLFTWNGAATSDRGTEQDLIQLNGSNTSMLETVGNMEVDHSVRATAILGLFMWFLAWVFHASFYNLGNMFLAGFLGVFYPIVFVIAGMMFLCTGPDPTRY